MKNYPLVLLSRSASLFLLCFILFHAACQLSQKDKWIQAGSDFIPYISAYTGGMISTSSGIKIRLTQPATRALVLGELAENDLFSFNPAISGKIKWENSGSLEFIPDQPLKNDQLYTAEFYLGKVTDTPEKLKRFEFSFKTIKQGAALHLDFLQTDSEKPDNQYLTGYIETADVCDAAKLAQALSAKQQVNELKLTWQPVQENNKYPFLISGILRKESASQVDVQFDSQIIGAEDVYTEIVKTNPRGEFVINAMKMLGDKDPQMQIHFSDPLQNDQVLNGLVKVYGTDMPDVAINGQVLSVFLKLEDGQSTTVELFPGIVSASGQRLEKGATYSASNSLATPGIEFTSNGNILPQAKGMSIPFSARHLNKADVKVIRILENNVPRFLSQNSLSGTSGIRQTGKVVAMKTIRLTGSGPADKSTTKNYQLKLDDLVSTEPGAIYRVELSFKKEYVDLSCLGNEAEMETPQEGPDFRKLNQASYYGYDEYYDEEYDGDYEYNWRERNNPCDPSFYVYGRKASANFIATSVGLMAKEGKDDSWHFYASDLLTGKPLPGVQLQVVDYQLQKIASLRSDNNGTASLAGELKETPFLVTATYGQQKSYLRLMRSEIRPTGSFDVSGAAIEEGLKLFMYTERGVWRPGDTIFLASMIHPESISKKETELPPLLLQVFNSRGQQFHKEIKPLRVDKTIHLFKIPTQESDPTGSYRAQLRVGSATFNKYLRVETVLPNRIKIKLNFPGDVIKQSKVNQAIQLNAAWLHGSPAGGLKAMVTAVLKPSTTSFKSWPGYSFDDPVASNSSEEITLFDGNLNEAGLAEFYTKIPGERRFPGSLNADFTVRIFEAGGRFSVDRFSKTWMPFSVYAGVKIPQGNAYSGALQTERKQSFDLISTDDSGNPAAGRNLLVSVYKLETNWWWQSSYDNVRDYYSSYSSIAVREEILKTSNNGKAVFTTVFEPEEAGAYLFKVCDADGKHCSGAVFNVAESDYQPSEMKEVKNPGELTISVDKEKYISGEQVKISFPSPTGGRAHISIEDGLAVLEEYWLETKGAETAITLKSNEKWAPNVYAQVTILQAHDHNNDLPLRLYGIVRIPVENKGSRLNPVMKTPAVFRPESPAEIVVSEKDGRAMDYTLAIVDEGLLDLTRFETPDPYTAMNATEALGVNTWDMYDEVIGKFSGKLEAEIKLGGDGMLMDREKSPKANRFTPVVRYLGPFHLKKGESAKHSIKLPAYYGSVRLMLVASSAEGAWGNSEKTVEVKNPLMLLTTLPRVISPGEEIDLPVNVFAFGKGLSNVQIQVKTDKQFSLLAGSTKTLRFDKEGDQVVFFRLKAGNQTGTGKITVSASAGNEKAGAETLLEIRSPNPLITEVQDIYLAPGGVWTGTIAATGMPSTCEARIELSGMPAIDLSKRLNYLSAYPHGCLEQITSSALPQLFLAKLVDLTDKDQKKTNNHVKSVIRRIGEYQNASGGFAYWPGLNYADDWACSYAGHFMAEAKLNAYTINEEVMKRWKRYQKSQADLWRPNEKQKYDNGMMQAYRLFTLALAGDADAGAMNRLREYKNLSQEAAALLAAAYAQTGQKEAALALLRKPANPQNPGAHYGFTYGDETRDEAIRLWVLSRLELRQEASLLARRVAEKMGKDQWMSTQSTSWSILAMSEFYRNRGAQRIDANIEMNGKNEKLFSNKPLVSKLIPLDKQGSQFIKLSNPNKSELFTRVITSGVPGTDYQFPAKQGKLKLTVNFSDLSGKPISIEKIKRGTDINITVMVTAAAGSKPGNDLALTMTMPSGWEIENNRISGMEASVTSNEFTWQDIRDDRVMTYFGMQGGSTKVFRFRVNASYAGKFYLPAWTCEAMYDDTFRCNTASGSIEIEAPLKKEIQ